MSPIEKEAQAIAETKNPVGGVPLTIKKRNGQLVPFFKARVTQAVEGAFKEKEGLPHEAALSDSLENEVLRVSDRVERWCAQRFTEQNVIFIEEVQDAVIEQLLDAGHSEVAHRFAAYRRRHERHRFNAERLTVEKRDGRVVSFKPEKIAVTIGAAINAVKPGSTDDVAVQHEILDLAEKAVQFLKEEEAAPRVVSIEEIQDAVELVLMDSGHHQAARSYILYRHEMRHKKPKGVVKPLPKKDVSVKQRDGRAVPLDTARLKKWIAEACRGLEDDVSIDTLVENTLTNCYNEMPKEKVSDAMLLGTKVMIERHPSYGFVAARLLLRRIYQEVLGRKVTLNGMKRLYPEAFKQSIEKGVEYERLSKKLLKFDFEKLGKAIRPERDLQFQYLGLQTLYDRYFLHEDGRRLESPQIFWMRVAMGLAIDEKKRNERAIEFYNVLSTFRFVSSTPTLFNSGTKHSQLSSCFLTTVDDDLNHIFKCVQDNAMLSKWSGGLGNDWTRVRAMGSHIKGTNGKSQGIVPFLKVANDTAVAVNQGGKRKGAVCAYLETWHLDIEEFLELRKNTGDDRRRTHDMNTANWIPDLFMKRVAENADWTLFTPSETPDLHDLFGAKFEKRYEEYEKLAAEGKIKVFKKVKAVQLWRKMLSMLFETGHPWLTFKDPCNVRSPQDHAGVVHSSNLCTEITLNTSNDETAVCNLGSINLAAHTLPSGLDLDRLSETVKTAVRMLDNVVDINYYPTVEAKTSNLQHRPVGMGMMGFQDALYIQGLSYASPKAVEFADKSMEAISFNAILGSAELAKERGAYPSFKGSKWDRGLLPIDTIEILEKERGVPMEMDKSSSMDWDVVRAAIKKHGMRNSNVMAIAPTATIANISGVTQSIEPTYKNLFVKSNMSGEFTTINPFLVHELKALGLWDDRMLEDLKYFDGSLQEVPRIPRALKDRYATAFEIDYEWIIECASRRQKWIDQAQSLNLYLAQPSGKKIHNMYFMAWQKGLKTTYYLRSLAATRIEKSTLDAKKYTDTIGRGPAEDKKEEAAEPAACTLGPGGDDCEACQ